MKIRVIKYPETSWSLPHTGRNFGYDYVIFGFDFWKFTIRLERKEVCE